MTYNLWGVVPTSHYSYMLSTVIVAIAAGVCFGVPHPQAPDLLALRHNMAIDWIVRISLYPDAYPTR